MMVTLHLIANAHLDPVWLWDWREGLSEGINTCRTMLDLMDEDKELVFSRGESVVYAYIQRHDPELFRRILARVKEGRWEVVGGTYLQADNNLASTETLCRNFDAGLDYFKRELGCRPVVAWSADCFGHPAGYPEILASKGMRYFLFTRPADAGKPTFWWEGPGGTRILCHRGVDGGWYGVERDGMTRKLDLILEKLRVAGRRNAAVFFGLGNHGGGPTRRHLAEIRAWREAHPEVRVEYSGMRRCLEALEQEERETGCPWPVHRGEFNFVLRGCYSSCARLKFEYRALERELDRAEIIAALPVASGLSTGGDADMEAALSEAERARLFNAFHDILPGTVGERPALEQIRGIGLGWHKSVEAEDAAIRTLANHIDTRVSGLFGEDHPTPVALLAVNPLLRPWRGLLELEASLDWRPVFAYRGRAEETPIWVADAEGKALPAQPLDTEAPCPVPDALWRARRLVPIELPAGGWSVLELGLGDANHVHALPPPSVFCRVGEGPADNPKQADIEGGAWRVSAMVGGEALEIVHRGQLVFGTGLSAALFDDPHGAWGDMSERVTDFQGETERFAVAEIMLTERGPLRAALWVALTGTRSRLELTFRVDGSGAGVEVLARAWMNERGQRLKLLFPGVREARCETPAGFRDNPGGMGETPIGRWARLTTAEGAYGWISPDLSDANVTDNAFQVTVTRSPLYADGHGHTHNLIGRRHLSVTDTGELRFRFYLRIPERDLAMDAEELLHPPLVAMVCATPGTEPRMASIFDLDDGCGGMSGLRILSLRTIAGGKRLLLRLHHGGNEKQTSVLRIVSQEIPLGEINPGVIRELMLVKTGNRWRLLNKHDGENGYGFRDA